MLIILPIVLSSTSHLQSLVDQCDFFESHNPGILIDYGERRETINGKNKYCYREVDHFKYLGSVLTRDGYCTREIKMRIAIAKEAFKRKMSLLKSKLNIELRKKLVRYYVWSIAQYGSET